MPFRKSLLLHLSSLTFGLMLVAAAFMGRVPSALSAPSAARVTPGPLALYTFNEGQGTTVLDESGIGAPLDLEISDSDAVTWIAGGLRVESAVFIASPSAASKIIEASQASKEITLELWIKPFNSTQYGPARILSLSSDTLNRNFTVGQGRWGKQPSDLYDVRLRTSTTDVNGRPSLASGAGSLTTELTHVVYTRDAPGVSHIYIDGIHRKEGLVDGDFSNWDNGFRLGLANEFTGDRPWLGEFYLLAIYNRSLSQAEVSQNFAAGPESSFAPTATPLPSPTLSSTVTPTDTAVPPATDTPVPSPAPSATQTATTVPSATDTPVPSPTPSPSPSLTPSVSSSPTSSPTWTETATSSPSRTPMPTLLLSPTQTSTVAPPSATPAVGWTQLSSATGDLPAPGFGTYQTASLILDVDNDGDNDFVIGIGRTGIPSMVWYRRTSTGWIKYLIDDQPLRIEAGGAFYDIDGDGDLDIVMGGDSGSNQVWWWENPNPAHNPNTPWVRRLIKDSGASKQHDQIFGDFDGDGRTELAFWNQGAKTLYLAEIPLDPKNTQPWSLTAIYTWSSGGEHEGLAKADIDGDGQIDILGGGRWFKYQGGSTYSSNIIDDAQRFTRAAVGQLVAGGRPEVVFVTGDGSGPLNWYEWTGSTWAARNLLGFDVDNGHSLELADLDSDGNLDIFVAEMRLGGGNADAKMWIFLGDGFGNFTQSEMATGFGNHESKVGDLDADGDLDILGKPFDWNTPRVDIWLANGTSGTQRLALDQWTRYVVDANKPWKSVFIASADVDGDEQPDILTGGWWYRNPGIPSGVWTRNEFGSPLRNFATAFDFDADGDIDVLGTQGQGTEANPNFAWARNDGSGSFTILANIEPGQGDFLQGAVVDRLQPAGPLEVALSWHRPGMGVQKLVVPDDPSTATWIWESLSPTSQDEALSAGYIDGDGDLDLILGTVWLRNEGSFWTPFTLDGTGDKPDRNRLADINQDGLLDVVVGFEAVSSIGKLAWYEQGSSPTGAWTEHVIANIIGPMSLDVVDMDGDGDLDVVVGEHDTANPSTARLLIYENVDGFGASWKEHLVYQGDEHHDGAQVVDIDGDGDQDIISIGLTHDRVLLYENKAIDDIRTPTPTYTPAPTLTLTPSPTDTPTPTLSPAPTPTLSVRFAVIGDYGLAGQIELDVANLVKSWNSDLIITTGDNNYPKGEASTIDQNVGQYFLEYIYPYTGSYGTGAAQNRFFPSIGNHDWQTASAQPYLDYFVLPDNERYYEFTWGPVRFFAINSVNGEPDGNSSSSLQANWLRDALAASTERWNIVYFHHAPYSSGALHGSSAIMQWPFAEWGATAVLAGHDHIYERLEVDGIPYFVNGLGANGIYAFDPPLPETQTRYNGDYGAMRVDASESAITFQFYSRSAGLVDEYTIYAVTPTPGASATAMVSGTPSPSSTPIPIATLTPSPAPSLTNVVTATQTASASPTSTPTFTLSATITSAPSATPSPIPTPSGRVSLGLQVLYTFEEGGGVTVSDVSDVGEPLDLDISDISAVSWIPGGLSIDAVAIISSSGPASKVIDASRVSNEITVEAWVRPANASQKGPARILTLSADPYGRNFTLGQGLWGSKPSDLYDVRLRTTTTSDNGRPSLSTAAGFLTTDLTHVIYTRDASGVARIYLDGVPRALGLVDGDFSNWDTGYRLALANELTGDRAWLGEFYLLAVYDRALSQVEVDQNFASGPN